ncbi:MAG: N-acetylmuramoyl-L-alanine amidase [Bacteroidota bacterium]
MWDKIATFFRIIFGLESETDRTHYDGAGKEEPDTHAADVSADEATPPPTEEEDDYLVEDASELADADPEVISMEQSEPHMRARGGIGGEGERFEYKTDQPITITTPRFLWCLDNGHGRLQKGKRSPFFEDGTQFEEWEFNRDVVKRMMKKLDEIGIQYFNVVPEVEVGSFLRERVARANNKTSPLGLPKIYVSVHANAMGMGDWVNGTKGIETWHFPNTSGKKLASAFQASLMEHLPDWKDRGLRSHQRSSKKIFYVLRKTSMPSVLTENGFYTDLGETTKLMQPEIRQAIADAHVAAIVKIEQEGYDNIPIYKPNRVLA